MLILTIRTDKPLAEIGLYDDLKQISYETWEAHRQLAETIHLKIRKLLSDNRITRHQLEGVAVYSGPGSFTGLRIGITVANALAAGYEIPIAGYEGKDWLPESVKKLIDGTNESVVMPEYGSLPNITAPRK